MAATVVVAVAVTGCTGGSDEPTPGASPSGVPSDPAAAIAAAVSPGSYATTASDYRLEDLQIPGVRLPVEVEGHVVGPLGATGPLPLVAFLHGYTASCWRASDGSSTTDWPCPKGFRPIPSWRGFTYLQERLASQGYLTVSLSANGVNVMATEMGDDAGAEARSALVTHHLDRWASGSVPNLEEWPDIDLGSVMLVGHSRGGEGVDRTVAERPVSAGWTVAGEVLIAPTAFEPAERSTVSVVALTGYCDGDVGPGPGQRYVDRPSGPELLRSSIVLDGANHNFFNAEWVPAEATVPGGYDDAGGENGEPDPMCAPGAPTRLTYEQQQDVAMRVLGLAAAAFLRGDTAAGDVLDGRVPVPVGGDELVRVAALGRGRTTLTYGVGYAVTEDGPLRAVPCDGVSETEEPDDCGRFTGEGQSVHWPAAFRGLDPDQFVEVTWSGPGGAARLDLAAPLDLTSSLGVEARVALAPEGPPVRFDVVLTDAQGRSISLPADEVLAPFPDGPLLPSRRWGQRLFAELPGTGVVDLSAITAITLAPSTNKGHAWVIDVSAVPTTDGGSADTS